jgi:hypothetical protein
VFSDCSDILADKLGNVADTGEAINVYPAIANCALDIICGRSKFN